MKIRAHKTAQDCIEALESLENNGGISRDPQGRIVPQSTHAKNLFDKAMGLLPESKRWSKLSPMGDWKRSEAERNRQSIFATHDLRGKN